MHQLAHPPEGDVLLHAGDFTRGGSLDEVRAFTTWFAAQPHRHKIVVAGNHDFAFERTPEAAAPLVDGMTYLQDAGVTIDGVRFWGSPWQPWFHNWAFNLERGAPIRQKWDLIPADTDVLITHGPPHGILDETRRKEAVGCEELRVVVSRVRPALHLFGHIHEGFGADEREGILFVNAAFVDFEYDPGNFPVVVDVERSPHGRIRATLVSLGPPA
jgi:Icc-related predicted phosphoesterase